MVKKFLVAVPSVMASSAMLSMVAFAEESGSAAADATSAVEMFKSTLSIMSIYPLNIFIGGGLVVMGLGIFAVAKRAAHK